MVLGIPKKVPKNPMGNPTFHPSFDRLRESLGKLDIAIS